MAAGLAGGAWWFHDKSATELRAARDDALERAGSVEFVLQIRNDRIDKLKTELGGLKAGQEEALQAAAAARGELRQLETTARKIALAFTQACGKVPAGERRRLPLCVTVLAKDCARASPGLRAKLAYCQR